MEYHFTLLADQRLYLLADDRSTPRAAYVQGVDHVQAISVMGTLDEILAKEQPLCESARSESSRAPGE